MYGVTQSGFSSIILDAKNHLISNPNDTVIINIDAGTYDIGGNGSNGIFINSVVPGVNGRLIIKGAGMDSTTLVFTEVDQDMIRISDSENIVLSDMHMTREEYTVTQGFVQSVGTGYIDLELQSGFPDPLALYNSASDQGRYLRRYTNSQTDPQVIQTNNGQIPWGYVNSVFTYPVLVSGNTWRFFLNDPNLLASNYSIGDLVGVKSKHEGETYFIVGGSDILIENIKWTHSTRGVARFGTNNLTIRKCRIERGDPINGQTPCMASPSGGPQMNQPNDAPSMNMIVDSCFIDSPGDDCVAFFNVDGGRVTNSVLKNSFSSRGIYIIPTAQNICVANDSLINNAIVGPYSICEDPSLGLQEIEKNKFLVYPNPNKGRISIRSDSNCSTIRFSVFNALGVLLSSGTKYSTSVVGIDLDGESGCYILEIRSDDGGLEYHKILRE